MITKFISESAMRKRLGGSFQDVRAQLLSGEISLKDYTGEYRVDPSMSASTPGTTPDDGPCMAIARRALAELAEKRAAKGDDRAANETATGPGAPLPDEEPPLPPAAVRDQGDQIVELMDAQRAGRVPAAWARQPLRSVEASAASEGPSMRIARQAIDTINQARRTAAANAFPFFLAPPGFAGKELR